VVVAQTDPFPQVAGGGLAQLRAAGLAVEVGLLEAATRQLNAPYLKLVTLGRPWVIAKWAMTLDGRIATRTGSSHWISNETSRAVAHRLRGRVDAILVGRGTVATDDPLLIARPPGPRIATRIVVDTLARLALESRLVRTARTTPVLVAVGPDAPAERRARLVDAGCEVWAGTAVDRQPRLLELLAELGRRRLTNVLVEGGGQLLGSLFDARAVDEVHVFLAPKLVGGDAAPGPIAGRGIDALEQALSLAAPTVERLDSDVYIHGRPGTLPAA
jgi:diaminohydroxyphosphoribosylaminopyrimidine deaminase/5-amino-6-(5-phosphoribosylamino)uracil reductase